MLEDNLSIELKDQADLAAQSPLWVATQKPMLNDFVTRLQQWHQQVTDNPSLEHEFNFSTAHLQAVRHEFEKMILEGEEKLHRLSQLLCHRFIPDYQIQSEIIGQVAATRKRFTLTLPITTDELYSTTDLDLGARQLRRFQYREGRRTSRLTLVANMVDYQPTEKNDFGIHKIRSRIKAEEELWNKVVDAIFDIDQIVKRDKQLRPLNRFVKDVFGIKIIVENMESAYGVQQELERLCWSDEVLCQFQVEPQANTRCLEFIEIKDYLADGKRSGWQALKSVVRWADKTFEIQIQTLQNYMREREYLTQESHTSFKMNRERVREQVAQKNPFFRFYRQLLRWLFLAPHKTPPVYPGIRVYLTD